MRLRATVEKRLPVAEGERALSPMARAVTFKGVYLWPAKITAVETKANYSRSTEHAYPYKVQVTRNHKDGTQTFSGTGQESRVYKRDILKTLEELQNPQAIARANRVESVARRIKASVAATALAAVGIFGGLAASGTFESTEASSSMVVHQDPVEPCASVVDGAETLVSISANQVPNAQKLGELVCHISNFDYQVIKQ